jgi:hypothetical protein
LFLVFGKRKKRGLRADGTDSYPQNANDVQDTWGLVHALEASTNLA